MKSQIFFRIVFVAAFLLRCGTSNDDSSNEGTAPKVPQPIVVKGPAPIETSLQCPKGTYLTFENFGAGFLSTYCLSCHSSKVPEGQRAGAPLAANFDTAIDAARYRALMLSKTQGETPSMPPGRPIKSSDKTAFTEWLNCGSPRNNAM